jgi:histidinol phosphatase-like enzyme
VNGGFVEEREMFEEKDQKRSHTLTCPHCRQAGDYELSWLVRTKKRQLPSRADERDRAKFAKARSYMVRKDDMVACKNIRCRKRFEVAGVQSVAFLE